MNEKTHPSTSGVTSQTCATLLAEALSAYVGKGSKFCHVKMDADLGLVPGTVKRLSAGDTTPDMTVLWQLIECLPVEFLAMLLAPLGIGGISRTKGGRFAAYTLDGRVAEMAALTGLHLSDTEFASPVSEDQADVIRALSQRCDAFLARHEGTDP